MFADPYSIFVYGSEAKGRLYIDDGSNHDYQQGSFIYDAFEFDGTTLRERPAPSMHANGQAKGLVGTPKKHLRVERVVFMGLTRQPRSAVLRPDDGGNAAAEGDLLQVTAEPAADGTWVATVKKPTCVLGAQWAMELKF